MSDLLLLLMASTYLDYLSDYLCEQPGGQMTNNLLVLVGVLYLHRPGPGVP